MVAVAVAVAGALTARVEAVAGRRVAARAPMLSAPAQSNLRFGQVSIFIVLLALVDAMGVVPPGTAGCWSASPRRSS